MRSTLGVGEKWGSDLEARKTSRKGPKAWAVPGIEQALKICQVNEWKIGYVPVLERSSSCQSHESQ